MGGGEYGTIIIYTPVGNPTRHSPGTVKIYNSRLLGFPSPPLFLLFSLFSGLFTGSVPFHSGLGEAPLDVLDDGSVQDTPGYNQTFKV